MSAIEDGSQSGDMARNRWLTILTTVLLLVFVFCLLLGRYAGPVSLLSGSLAGDEMAQQLIWNLRLPRLIVALLLGLTLGASGEVFQRLFANPLVEPGLLGVSQGAAFGAAFSIILFGNSIWMLQLNAVLFAFIGLGTSYLLAQRAGFGSRVLRLLLAGIAVSALFSAGVGVLKYMADPLSQLPQITFWLLGGLYGITWQQALTVLPVVTIGLFAMVKTRWRLNLLSLDDESSFSLGLAPQRERAWLLIMATSATAVLISISGMVGWVGLIVPHLGRKLFGADASLSLPAAMLIGGITVMICDALARTLLIGEIPLGIITSLFGALAFMVLMLLKGIRIEA